MKLTEEQQAIIASTPPVGGSLLVTAFAGTGKTFTLQKYAEQRPSDRILYAAFNKAIQLEADRKMPANVMCRTTHSLAYRACGVPYQEAGLLRGYVPLWGVAKLLEVNIVLANFALQVVANFIASPDPTITSDHISQEIYEYYKGAETMPPFEEMAKVIWEDMKRMSPRSLPMIHDGYLKLYQLSGPVLDFDYILLDEAQDTTPCVWDIFENQKCRKVIVGDEHQAIYGWRGSTDALKLVGDAEHLYLTRSFRFGPEIAALASTLLRRFKGEVNHLRGTESIPTRVILGSKSGSRTMVCRGNMHIFRSAAAECEFGGKSLGFVGGDFLNYRFQSVLDAYYVFSEQSELVKDALIKSFGTFEDLAEFSKKARNNEIESACSLVEEYRSRVPKIYQDVKGRDVGAKFADLVFTTGHKAKGMEFPIVEIGSDFTAMIEAHRERPDLRIMNPHEINLLYVAITRATRELYLAPSIVSFIQTGALDEVPSANPLEGEQDEYATLRSAPESLGAYSGSPRRRSRDRLH
jgi:superfamily I DNA/RNA helicase